jgi:hypothetical protein
MNLPPETGNRIAGTEIENSLSLRAGRRFLSASTLRGESFPRSLERARLTGNREVKNEESTLRECEDRALAASLDPKDFGVDCQIQLFGHLLRLAGEMSRFFDAIRNIARGPETSVFSLSCTERGSR